MLTVIFLILMFAVFGNVIGLAFRLTWGLTKILFTIVFLPVILLGLFFSGLAAIALPLLILVGLYSLICRG